MNSLPQTESYGFQVVEDDATYRGHHSQRLCPPEEVPTLIANLAEMVRGEVHLKKGDRTTVSRTIWKRNDLVVKHYFHRNLWHSLRRLHRKSRARHSWEAARRLMALGIPTPTPLAYVERWCRGLMWEAFLITEYLNGTNLARYLESLSPEGDEGITTRLADLLERMSRVGIIHGDLKATNICVTRKGLYLTDLDGLAFCRPGFGFPAKRNRDHARLLRDLGPSRSSRLEIQLGDRFSA